MHGEGAILENAMWTYGREQPWKRKSKATRQEHAGVWEELGGQ